MKKNLLSRLPLIAVAALPLTVGLVFAQTTGIAQNQSAQNPQRVPPLQPGQRSNQTQPNQGTPQTQRQQSGTNYSEVFIQKLAAGLGISVDKLKAAATAASKATVADGVKAGDFPADAATNMNFTDHPFALAGGRGMRGGHGDGDFGGRGGRGGDFGGPQGGNPQGQQGQGAQGQLGGRGGDLGRGGPMQAVNAAVAKALGLTEQQLLTELQNGKTIAQLAQAKGVSTAALHAAAVNALKTQLAADVKAGRFTQAQADQMIQQAQADTNFGLQPGGRGRGGMRGGQDNNQAPAAQDSNISG